MAGPKAGSAGGPGGRGRRGLGAEPCRGMRSGPRSLLPDEALAALAQGGGGRYRRSVLEVAILSSLAETTSHGYELIDRLESLASELVCIDAGSIYRLLRAMEEDGLVASAWETPESGPPRRVYEITPQGVEALELMVHALSQRATSIQRLADHGRQAVARFRDLHDSAGEQSNKKP